MWHVLIKSPITQEVNNLMGTLFYVKTFHSGDRGHPSYSELEQLAWKNGAGHIKYEKSFHITNT